MLERSDALPQGLQRLQILFHLRHPFLKSQKHCFLLLQSLLAFRRLHLSSLLLLSQSLQLLLLLVGNRLQLRVSLLHHLQRLLQTIDLLLETTVLEIGGFLPLALRRLKIVQELLLLGLHRRRQRLPLARNLLLLLLHRRLVLQSRLLQLLLQLLQLLRLLANLLFLLFALSLQILRSSILLHFQLQRLLLRLVQRRLQRLLFDLKKIKGFQLR